MRRTLLVAALCAALVGGVAVSPVTAADEVKNGDWFEVTVRLPGATSPAKVWVQADNGRGLFEGDIDLGPIEELREPKADPLSVFKNGQRWPNNVVPYDDTGLNAQGKALLAKAVQAWNGYLVNLKWVKRTTQPIWVKALPEDSPNSSICGTAEVGRRSTPGSQTLKFRPTTNQSCVMHEMLHSMGAQHEHTRPDRDNFVKINTSNIDTQGDPNILNNWAKQPNGTPVWATYDFKSIMHYSAKAGGKSDGNGGQKVVIQPLNASNVIAPSINPTPSDVAGIDSAHSPYVFDYPSVALPQFGSNQGYSNVQHIRQVADVTGDNVDDVFAFGPQGAVVSINNGSGVFASPKVANANFGYADNWRIEKHVRVLAQVEGDDKLDIVGFGDNGVVTAVNNGNGIFGAAKTGHAGFGYLSNWRVEKHLRLLRDVNNDGKADVVAFGDGGVIVALNKGNGTFNTATLAVDDFGYNQGYRPGIHPRDVIDVNNDNKLDIVAFGPNGTIVMPGNGNGTFSAGASFNEFSAAQGYNADYPRFIADMNGDGFKDLVAFAHAGTFVAFNKKGTGIEFFTPVGISADFGYGGGWRIGTTPRLIADVNGDSKPDVVGFGPLGVIVVANDSTPAQYSFRAPRKYIGEFGSVFGNWNPNTTVRSIAKLNGDGAVDFLGFGQAGVITGLNKGDRVIPN